MKKLILFSVIIFAILPVSAKRPGAFSQDLLLIYGLVIGLVLLIVATSYVLRLARKKNPAPGEEHDQA